MGYFSLDRPDFWMFEAFRAKKVILMYVRLSNYQPLHCYEHFMVCGCNQNFLIQKCYNTILINRNLCVR